MGIIRRFLSVGLGIAAGAFAYKLLKDYNNDGHIEGEYVELPLQEPAPQKPAAPEAAVPHPVAPDNGPNPNPVTLGGTEKPLTENGTLDPTRIASPEDFAEWDELGCQG